MRAAVQSRAGALTLVVVGALAAVQAWSLGIGSAGDPGPGLWPFLIGLALVVVSATLLLRPDPDAVEPIGRDAVLVAAGAASLVAYTWLFERVGFEIPTMLLLVLWLRVFGRDRWRITVAVAVGTTIAVYLLFIVGLGVSLPHLFTI